MCGKLYKLKAFNDFVVRNSFCLIFNKEHVVLYLLHKMVRRRGKYKLLFMFKNIKKMILYYVYLWKKCFHLQVNIICQCTRIYCFLKINFPRKKKRINQKIIIEQTMNEHIQNQKKKENVIHIFIKKNVRKRNNGRITCKNQP